MKKCEVTAAEMMRMREEEGLSNAEIAKRLDISYSTVKKYIGTQPDGIKAPYGSRKKPVEPKVETFIKMTSCFEQYEGKYGSYTVDRVNKTIRANMAKIDGILDIDGVKELVAELCDVYQACEVTE